MRYIIIFLFALFACSSTAPKPQPITTIEIKTTERLISELVERSLRNGAIQISAKTPILVPNPRQMDSREETLRVTGDTGDYCTAIAIAPRLAVTALHCARSLCKTPAPGKQWNQNCSINYEVTAGIVEEAFVVATNDDDLIALVDLRRSVPQYSSLRCDDPHANDRVYTVSRPESTNWLVTYGWLVSGPISLEWTEGQATKVLVAKIPTEHGSSGGGLFDFDNRVIGVQVARWSAWTTDYGKAAFIHASRIYKLAGNYCMGKGSKECVGLNCSSEYFYTWQPNK